MGCRLPALFYDHRFYFGPGSLKLSSIFSKERGGCCSGRVGVCPGCLISDVLEDPAVPRFPRIRRRARAGCLC